MPNITLSINDELLKSAREYAEQHHTTLNELVRMLLSRQIGQPGTDWLEESFNLADAAGASSEGRTWTREEIYDVQDIH